ncbi:hypothetical protein [Luteolibacter soli]|uniref:Uncharacterized protein n=1 Tax=Luteolibacter soli TaxID=3135280 RepID=A0ABU9AS26_9BACT
MNAIADGDLILAKAHLRQCKPETILEAPVWWQRRRMQTCHFIAAKLERHSFTEPGAKAATLKKTAARLRNSAATIQKIIDADPNDNQP